MCNPASGGLPRCDPALLFPVRLFLTVPDQKKDPHFYAEVFNPLQERLGQLKRRYVLKDSRSGRLRAIVQDVKTLNEAVEVLEMSQTETVKTATTQVFS